MSHKQKNQRIALAIVLIAAIFTTWWQPAVASQRIPLLHWYNGQSGSTAVGTIGGDDRFYQQPSPGDFSPGWTHGVHLPDAYYMLVYNAYTGAAATVWLNNAGHYVTVDSFAPGSFTTGWSSIVAIGKNRILFYRASDGLAALGEIDGNGHFTTVRTYSNFSPGWSQIVHTQSTGLLFYNRVTGTVAVGYFDGYGNYVDKKVHKNVFSTGWTDIVYYASNQQIVYYNQNSGSLAIGKLDRNGNHVTVTSYHYTSGWTNVVPMHGKVLFYNGTNGAAALVRVGTDGKVTTKSWPVGTFSAGWRLILYGY